MFARKFNNKIEEVVSEVLKKEVKLLSVLSVAGGSINNAYRIKTSAGDFFLKENNAARYPNMFAKEIQGLRLLTNAQSIRIPKVIACDEIDTHAFLMLEFISSSTPHPQFWQTFGEQLATLHQCTHDHFGLDHDNYIGSLHQANNLHNTWSEFFIHERLLPQIRLAKEHGQIDTSTVSKFESLFNRLDEIFPEEPPALLNGDLWSGNFMVGDQGEPVIMDPAVYYGHREMDLAMTKLFGGFDAQLYDSYNSHFPLEKGWEQRMDICNLYPLMVHVNLFGGGYLGQVKSILSQF